SAASPADGSGPGVTTDEKLVTASGATSALERAIAAFAALPRLASADADLVRRGHFLTCDLEIGVGRAQLAVEIRSGAVARLLQGPFLLRPYTFAIRAEPEVWLQFLQPFPAPGFHVLLALNKTGRARIEGDLVPLMGNLQYVKDLLALPRRLHADGGRS
ncbi:MAG: hypothetical protein AB7F78_06280, partial [Hyphomicrobiaceae bacterium]